MNPLARTLNNFDTIFRCYWGMPPFLKTIATASMMVLVVPLLYLTNAHFYSNAPMASQFFTKWFFLNNALFLLHIAAAFPAVATGPFLLDKTTRQAYPKMHRAAGQWYVWGCMISALTVVPLALKNTPGSIAAYGFTPMAVIWFFTTYFAYTAARHKDFISHRRWIIRSYAMTFAFVHVNITFKLFFLYVHMPESLNVIKAFQSMVSWQVNLLIMEIYLAATTFKGRYVGWSKFWQTVKTYPHHDKIYWRFSPPKQA